MFAPIEEMDKNVPGGGGPSNKISKGNLKPEERLGQKK